MTSRAKTDLDFLEEHTEDWDCWALRGPEGGVHIWRRPSPDFGHYGGIEIHSKKQLYDFDPKPTHENCWLLGCPCYHDGSSLYFETNIKPLLELRADNLTAMMRSILVDWYVAKFGVSA